MSLRLGLIGFISTSWFVYFDIMIFLFNIIGRVGHFKLT